MEKTKRKESIEIPLNLFNKLSKTSKILDISQENTIKLALEEFVKQYEVSNYISHIDMKMIKTIGNQLVKRTGPQTKKLKT